MPKSSNLTENWSHKYVQTLITPTATAVSYESLISYISLICVSDSDSSKVTLKRDEVQELWVFVFESLTEVGRIMVTLC